MRSCIRGQAGSCRDGPTTRTPASVRANRARFYTCRGVRRQLTLFLVAQCALELTRLNVVAHGDVRIDPMANSDLRQRVTARDVANACGVSQSTVSFVLNDTPGQTIPERTRNLVLETANRLGYLPNASAQILAGGRSRFVILALHDLPLGDLVNSFEQTAVDDLLQQGFIPVVARSRERADTSVLRMLAASLRPVAVISIAPLSAKDQQILRHNGNPRLIHTFANEEEFLQPFKATGEAQARYLAERGHEEIGFLRTTEPSLGPFVDATMDGAERGSISAGVTFAGALDWTGDLDEMVQALSDFLRSHPKVTAFCAYNDQVAFALLAAARKIGVAVPSQLAVVGADDLPMSRLVSPTLSSATYQITTRPPLSSLKQLILARDDVAQTTTVEVEIVQREST